MLSIVSSVSRASRLAAEPKPPPPKATPAVAQTALPRPSPISIMDLDSASYSAPSSLHRVP